MTLPLASRVHIASRGGGSFLAVVQKMGFAVGHANQHEPAATDISGRRMNYRQREARSDGRVDGIASGLQDFDTDLGSKLMHADHHRVLGMYRMGGPQAGRDGEQHQTAMRAA